MFDGVALFLGAAWPTIVSGCLLTTTLFAGWRSVTARPGSRRRRPKRSMPVVVAPTQQSVLPPWQGVRH
jgi:hypothetical protein